MGAVEMVYCRMGRFGDPPKWTPMPLVRRVDEELVIVVSVEQKGDPLWYSLTHLKTGTGIGVSLDQEALVKYGEAFTALVKEKTGLTINKMVEAWTDGRSFAGLEGEVTKLRLSHGVRMHVSDAQ